MLAEKNYPREQGNEPSGEELMKTLISLLAEQENVTIEYELVKKENAG